MEFLPWKTPAMDEWMKTPFGAKMIQVPSCYNESLNEHFKMCECLPSTKLIWSLGMLFPQIYLAELVFFFFPIL